MLLITTMLSHSSSEKVKDAHSSLEVLAVTLLMSSAVEVAEDAAQLVEVVDSVTVILSLMDANTIILTLIMIARMIMVLIMLDFLNYKFLEEVLEASALLVL
jgi:hypothetical protein